jgi:hypothetical protein
VGRDELDIAIWRRGSPPSPSSTKPGFPRRQSGAGREPSILRQPGSAASESISRRTSNCSDAGTRRRQRRPAGNSPGPLRAGCGSYSEDDLPQRVGKHALADLRLVAGAGYAECYTAPETYWLDLR